MPDDLFIHPDAPDIRPEMAGQLWAALLAITHAVECIEAQDIVNDYHRAHDGVGAHDLARMVIEAAQVKEVN